MTHEPVMLQEVLDGLRLQPGGTVVDGTLGLAGHARHLAQSVRPNGVLYGFDWDEAMLAEARTRLAHLDEVEVRLRHADFREVPETLDADGVRADGVLLDLGLNSAQVDDPERGISFRENGPLDMRMDRSRGTTAAELLNRWSPDQIEDVLFRLGDERWARAIARKVVERRRERPLRTTQDLVECVLAAVPARARDKRIHPATRTFQAVRLAVTGELNGLEEAVGEISDRLNPGGAIAVLSYHSGEDRAVKHAFRARHGRGFHETTRKPLEPTEAEVARNPRSRSAKLRVLRRDQNVLAHGMSNLPQGNLHG